MNEERKGKPNSGEIIPWCEECGELLDVDWAFDYGLVHHQWYEFTCEKCKTTNELQMEHCWFSRKKMEKSE